MRYLIKRGTRSMAGMTSIPVLLAVISTTACAQQPQMSIVHELVMNHDRVTRTVTNLPNGVRAVTESSDPTLSRMLKEHVATVGALLEQGRDSGLPVETPSVRTLSRNRDRITMRTDTTRTGVVVVQTSSDAETVAALQAHAADISDLVREGMPALHRAMSTAGGGAMQHGAMHAGDSAFAGVQTRGADPRAMGVDQYTSSHQFDALPDGGRIELQRAVDDSAGVAQIRQHLREIATAFAKGDFSIPAFVHDQKVPGTAVMAAKGAVIRYTVRDLPRGGEVRITTADPEALAAIHEFVAFQRQDHHAGGKGTPR
jgi:hypothetical protein